MKPMFFFVSLCAFAITAMFFLSCKKDKDGVDICSGDRTIVELIANKQGSVYYYDLYNSYGIIIDTTFEHNIDNTVLGLTCNLPVELRQAGRRVTFSGVLKSFNADENVKPSMGGQQLYFLEIEGIE